LQIVFMNRFCKFQNTKPLDCNMQVARDKPVGYQIIFNLILQEELSEGRKQTTKQNVNIWKGNVCALTSNGPAVCFSRRNPTTAPGRVLIPRASGAAKLSRCKEGLARVFAVMVQIFLHTGAIAVQF
jgi:hypothetical protein